MRVPRPGARPRGSILAGPRPRGHPGAATPGQKLDICPDLDPGPDRGPVGADAPGPPHFGPGFAPGLPRVFRTREGAKNVHDIRKRAEFLDINGCDTNIN